MRKNVRAYLLTHKSEALNAIYDGIISVLTSPDLEDDQTGYTVIKPADCESAAERMAGKAYSALLYTRYKSEKENK